MLIVALVLAVVGLAALVTAVVTSNELVAWVCIAASALGVLLLIVDAIRERQLRRQGGVEPAEDDAEAIADAEPEAVTDYPEEEPEETPEEAAATDEGLPPSDVVEETAHQKP